MSRTKVFLLLFFLPAWFASLMSWGDERTSASFNAAPHWFYQLQLVIQVAAIGLMFLPLRMKQRPSLLPLFLSVLVIVALYFSRPSIEGEYVLISGSILIAVVAIFLSVAQPSATFEESDIAFLFALFLGGFLLQFFMFLVFGIMPSHSSENLYIRFNGITNDSLASGFILPLFVPWAIRSRYSLIKILLVLSAATATGSLFSAVFVPAVVLAYLIYYKRYVYIGVIATAMAAVLFYFYDTISRIMDLKIESIVTHLRLFLNLTGANFRQTTISCSREFCESFIESGSHLSVIYLVAFLALILCFVVPLLRRDWVRTSSPVVTHTLRVYGIALIAAAFVHPIPIVPYAIPLFMLLTSLYFGKQQIAQRSAQVAAGPARAGRVYSAY